MDSGEEVGEAVGTLVGAKENLNGSKDGFTSGVNWSTQERVNEEPWA